MSNRIRRVIRLLLAGSVYAAVAGGAIAIAEDSKAPREEKPATGKSLPSSESRAEELALLSRTARSYTMKLGKGGKRTAELNEKPVFRWNNAIAGTKDAALFLWMSEGRPVVAATM